MKSLFFKVILPLFGIVAILGFLTWFNPIQGQKAAFSGQNVILHCGNAPLTLKIGMNESPSCQNDGNVVNLASYQTTANIVAEQGGNGAYTVRWRWGQYFCPTADPHAPCTQNGRILEGVGNLTGAGQGLVSAVSDSIAHPGFTNACGYYQNDLALKVFFNGSNTPVCTFGNWDNPAASTPVAAWCHTVNAGAQGVSCSNNPTPTATPTPTNAPTATPTPTGAPTATPTPTGAPTATPTPTGAPTATPTPTGAPTATPTPENSNNCNNTNQSGTNDNNNCNNNNNTQSQNQTQNNNQTVNITLGNGQQQQQQVLAAATVPTQLPSTGAESDILFGLLALIPVGWKIRKLI